MAMSQKTEHFSPALAAEEFDADLFGQLIKDATAVPALEDQPAFDISQFVNDDTQCLATPSLIGDDLPTVSSPYETSPASGHLGMDFMLATGDYSSLFSASALDPALSYSSSFSPPFAAPLDMPSTFVPTSTQTCSPLELGLSLPPTDSPPFGMLPSPTDQLSDMANFFPSQDAGLEVKAEDAPVEAGNEVETRGKRKRKEGKYTGFRNSSVAPVSMDAPIASRNYVMPSATSRKEVPVLMQRQIKKRKTGKAASAEAEPTSTGDLDKETVDAITQKRLQNTVAARRSRQRKQEELQRLKDELQEWQNRAIAAEARLVAAGL